MRQLELGRFAVRFFNEYNRRWCFLRGPEASVARAMMTAKTWADSRSPPASYATVAVFDGKAMIATVADLIEMERVRVKEEG